MTTAADALMRVFGLKRAKIKTCKYCKAKFSPSPPAATVCSPECAANIAEKMRAKVVQHKAREKRKETKAALDKLKTLPTLKAEAQAAFNKFIRLRDIAAGHPCICCGKPLQAHDLGGNTGGKFDAGHYRSVGSAPHLRFDERNCHAQRKYCNSYGAGRAVDYRLGLIARIGLQAVEALESDNTPRKYSRDELRGLKAEYTRKARGLTTASPETLST